MNSRTAVAGLLVLLSVGLGVARVVLILTGHDGDPTFTAAFTGAVTAAVGACWSLHVNFSR